MTHPDPTLAFYDDNAATVADRQTGFGPHRHLAGFAALLPQGGAVLDLGCGGGRDTLGFLELGFRVTASDGSAGLAAEASGRTGLQVRVQRFGALDDVAAFDGVWASASLLHAPRNDLPDIFARIARALMPGGHLYCSFKASADDWTDAMGRFFCAMDARNLRRSLTAAGFDILDIHETQGSRTIGGHGLGPDGAPAAWVAAIARKRSC